MAKSKKMRKKNKQALNLLLSTGLATVSFAVPSYAAVSTQSELNSAIVSTPVGGTISIDANSQINLSSNLISVNKNVSIDGNNSTINSNNFGGFTVTASNFTALKNITIDGANGGAFKVTKVTDGIYNSHFTNNRINSANANGGAIYMISSFNGRLEGSSFVNNTVTGTSAVRGGAIYFSTFADNANFTNLLFENNQAISSNTSTGHGGAIAMFSNNASSMTNSTITGTRFLTNSANSGGAIYFQKAVSASTFMDNRFVGNTASNGSGGAIYVGSNFNSNDISNTVFENNTAQSNGGAIYVAGNYSLGTIEGTSFTGNSANGNGGAIYVGGDFKIDVRTDSTTTFSNNTDSSGTNSIYFANSTGTNVVDLNINGTLNLFDPIRSASSMSFTKRGAGLLTLGGASDLGNDDWNIEEGTLKLTYDSQRNAAQINNAQTFSLYAGAVLQVVPDISIGNVNPAQINATNIVLDGQTTVGSDYRYIERLNLEGEQTLLSLSTAFTGSGGLVDTAGNFLLGQYDYEYENLHWDGNDLIFSIKARSLNAERNGAYSANADFRSRLENKTPHLIFEHFRKPFGYLKANQSQQHLAPMEKTAENLWGSAFYSKINYSAHDGESSANGNISGLILGQDFNVRDDSFNGVAVSIAWPNYEQNTLEANGKDIRLNFYGGKLLKDNWELGYIATAGFGDMSHDRLAGNINTSGKKDVKTYALGFNLAKDFYQDQDSTLRPFFSYEYIKTNSGGYTESDPLVGITAAGHRESTSRVRLGLDYIKHSKNNSSFVGTVFYQGLYGDRSSSVSSHMTSNPNSLINLSGASVDKHALGLGLGWNKRFNERINLNLSYNALFSANANDHQVKAELNFNF